MNLGETAQVTSRPDLLALGNEMQRRAWRIYQYSHDEKHADRAEWWREQMCRALDEARK